MQQSSGEKAVGSVRLWESIVALLFLVFGSAVMWDSWRIGARWGGDGPQAGYFPFYIGVFIVVSALAILYAALRMDAAEGGGPFVRRGELKMVLTVFVPSIVYVFLIDNPWFSLGIYVPSALFIAAFMRVAGRYGWVRCLAVGIVSAVVLFWLFEIRFLVPLPKGPLEGWLGY